MSDCKGYLLKVTLAAGPFRGKWKLQTLCTMRSGPVRLAQLTRFLPLASKKALLAALRDLEQAGIVVRQDLSGNVLHVKYDIAIDMKDTIYGLLDHLTDWAAFYEARTIVKSSNQ